MAEKGKELLAKVEVTYGSADPTLAQTIRISTQSARDEESGAPLDVARYRRLQPRTRRQRVADALSMDPSIDLEDTEAVALAVLNEKHRGPVSDH